MARGRDRNQYRACTRKVGHDSETAAMRHGQQAYLCHFCGKWHAWDSGFNKLRKYGHWAEAVKVKLYLADRYARKRRGKHGKRRRNRGDVPRQAARRDQGARLDTGLGD